MKRIILVLIMFNCLHSNSQCWKTVDTGPSHQLAIKGGGTLWAWGKNYRGSFGNGIAGPASTPIISTPQQIGTDTNWAAVAVGDFYSLGLKTDGTLWAWGWNNYGQLGDGTQTDKLSPVQIGTNTNWKSIYCGAATSFAIKTDGTLWGWGRSSSGELANGNPFNVLDPQQIGTANNWATISIDNVIGSTCLALKTDGTLWAWGQNNVGQFGNGTTDSSFFPVQIGTLWRSISSSSNHSLGIKFDNSLWAWGGNIYGELGDNTTVGKLSPVQIGTNWSSISTKLYTNFGVKTDGTLWSWGLSNNLGLGSGVSNQRTPQRIGTGTNWSSVINAYGVGSLGFKTDGTLWTWGTVPTLVPLNLPTATVTASNNGPVCTGNTLSLTSSTIAGGYYSWTGPNGFTSTQQNPTVSTTASTAMGGLYTVSVNGCSNQTSSTSVIINQAIAGNNGPVCAGNTLTLTASSIPGATYFWTGPNGFSSTLQNPTVSSSSTAAMAGVYSVYTVANGCTSPTPGTTSVTVKSIPSTPSPSNNGPVCIGNTLSLTASAVSGATYSWTGPNGFTSTQQNPTVSASATTTMGGVYNVTAIVNGCSSVIGSTTVEINKITATNNGPVCVANPLLLFATPVTGAVYSWTGPNGFSSSQQNPTVSNSATTAMAGVYSVTSTVNGCVSTASVTIVTINPAVATPIVTPTVTYCQNATATQLTATGSNLLWFTSAVGGIGSSIAPIPVTTVAGTTTYYVSQTTSCESPRVSITITVNPLPANPGTISGSATVCQGQNGVTYTVPSIANATSYVWTMPTGATGTSTTNSITVNYGTSAVSGNITVKGTNSCGNGAITTVAIIVNPLVANAGNITGNATICQGQNGVTYTVPSIANATSYVWTLPTGVTGTSTTNSITVNYGTSAVSGNITVKGTNTCGNGTISSLAIIVNPLVANAGNITGSATVCQGQNGVTYTVSSIANATSYVWTLPTGVIGASTTNSITVNYGNSAVSGNITVKGTNTCGNGLNSTLSITVNPLPANAGTIAGATTVCQGQSGVTYTVPLIINATSYVWTLPTGATGTSTTNSITVNYGNSVVSGNITVKGNNTCGDGLTSTLPITVNQLPANAGTISGSATVCQGQNSITYSVPAISGATSYVWTLPTGVTGTSTTNSINVNFSNSAVSAGIEVYGQNSCGNGSSSIIAVSVNSYPVSAGTISGSTTVCQGQNAVTYTVPLITGASSYVWTMPTGATGTSTSNSITLNYGASAVSGNITVKGNNSCGFGTSSTLAITVNLLPLNAGTISGTTTVCQGQTSVFYAVPSISNATSYVWALPSGATGTSTTNTINVNYSSSVSGNLIVLGNNSCGNGASFSLPITVISTPSPTGNILQNFTQGQTLSNLQVTGANLVWYATLSNATNHINPIANTTLLVNGSTYYVTQTNNGCESAPLAITVNVTLGINDLQKDKFIYYPNPVSSVVNFENNNPILKITLFNLLGQRVEEKEINSLSGQLDMSKLPSGNYLLKFKTDNGESIIKLVRK